MHFRFIKHVIPGIKVCYVASRTKDSELAFIEELQKEYPDVEFVSCDSDYRKASANADIVVTAVSCQEPLLKADMNLWIVSLMVM
jgi:ornithine cyclodeaminase/alanine dehydrogenase-like protein (mu-crystallin family)